MSRSAALLPFLCIALGACRLTTDVSPGLDVALSLNRTVASPATTIEITVSVVNRSPRNVQTDDPRNYGCVAPYEVINDLGRVVGPPGRNCLAIAYAPLELAPGDSLVLHDRWSLDIVDSSGQPVPVSPGRYRLVARVFGDNRQLGSEPVAVSVTTTGTP
jgi:hypothetical protein